jgi:hypothetical protein
MKRSLILSVGVLLAVAWLLSVAALAQGPEYTLKDYMPEAVGSSWTLSTTGAEGEETVAYEVLPGREIDGQKAVTIVMREAEGQAHSGMLQAVTPDKVTIFGSLSRGRDAEAGAEPSVRLYKPPATFPGKLRVGQSAEQQVKMSRQNGEVDITLKVQLAAVETVTVPKGTFADCLKLVYTTSYGERTMTRTVWYAKGVGMVKTEQGGRSGRPARVAELTDYKLAK